VLLVFKIKGIFGKKIPTQKYSERVVFFIYSIYTIDMKIKFYL